MAYQTYQPQISYSSSSSGTHISINPNSGLEKLALSMPIAASSGNDESYIGLIPIMLILGLITVIGCGISKRRSGRGKTWHDDHPDSDRGS